VSVYYVDTSAALKLLAEESDSQAFAQFYETTRCDLGSSALLRIEVVRALPGLAAALNDARDLLLAFDYVNIDDGIVQAAMDEPDRSLGSLDAIHPYLTARLFQNSDLDVARHVPTTERLRPAAIPQVTVLSPRD